MTIEQRFVETVMAKLWRQSVVDASWPVSWRRRAHVAYRLVMTVFWTVLTFKRRFPQNPSGTIGAQKVADALWMVLWYCHGRFANCAAMTVLWKPSWESMLAIQTLGIASPFLLPPSLPCSVSCPITPYFP